MPPAERARSGSATTIHRASVACQTCRTRKVKCDAQSAPPGRGCTPCKRAGHECVLDPLSDGRRFVSRKVIDRLQQRIETLEAINSQLGGNGGGGATVTGMASDTTFNTAYSSPPASTAEMADAGNTTATNTENTTSPPSDSTPVDDPPSFYGATSHPHVVSQDSRDASQQPNHMTIFDELDAVGIDLDINSPHLRATLLQLFFKYQILWVSVVDKEAFLSHQALQNSSPHQPLRWYSKFLESTMLACGARLSTSKAVRALGSKYCDWAKTELVQAMSEPTPANLQGFLLMSEYEVTRGNNRLGWMLCGLACRMMSDLGLHKLASVTSPPLEGTGTPSARECALARDLMASCIAYEGVWTLYLGRPSSIPKSVMSVAAEYYRAYSTSTAMQSTLPAHSRWLVAWVGLCLPMAEISNVLNERSLSDDERSVSLRQLFREVDVWYRSLPPELSYDENRVINMEPAAYGLHTQYCKVQIFLRRALAGRLPAEVRPHSSSPPQMQSIPQHSQAQAEAPQPPLPSHRGNHSHRNRQRSAIVESTVVGSHAVSESPESVTSTVPSSTGTPTTHPLSSLAHSDSHSTSIYQYGFRIARLVVTYREAFGVEKIPSIMLDNAVVAATAMIGHLNNLAEQVDSGCDKTGQDKEAIVNLLQRDTIWLRQLLVSIETVQPHFPIIGRMLETLKRICGNGPLGNMLYGKPSVGGVHPSSTLDTLDWGYGRHASQPEFRFNARRSSHSQAVRFGLSSTGPPPPSFGSFFSTTDSLPTDGLFSQNYGPVATSSMSSASANHGNDAETQLGSHTTSYVQDSLLTVDDGSSMGMGASLNIGLDGFGSEIDPGFFSTAGLDDLVMDLPMPVSMTEQLLGHEVPDIM
ncbi:hypothetical protein SBRCBS47491_009039 [Sporothrix bragantina]|uniref:Zn(2)-C6 fungal-type domain-containing protein n=1 Tax=Sporothrix bragantina TaxID=671064 RepID=A0ABP0CU42_9PEZI